MINDQKNIKIPLLFFDLYDYPLTAVEVWQWQFQNSQSLGSVKTELENMAKTGILDFKQSFYFLPGKEENVIKRLDRYNIADEKYKKLKVIGWFLSRCPYVKMMAVCNTLAYSNAEDDSDIDLFIVTAKNRIWLTRFWCIALLKLCRLQPDPKNMKNKLCLSFFVTEDALDLKNYMLPEKDNWPDIYFLFWFITLYPVYDSGKVFEKLWQENSWVKDFFPEAKPAQVNKRREIGVNLICRGVKKFKEAVTSIMGNKFYKNVQLKVLPKKLHELMNKDTRVIMNDKVLKFHDNDSREKIRENVELRMKN